jgi:hypothetical protein
VKLPLKPLPLNQNVREVVRKASVKVQPIKPKVVAL